MNSFFVLVPPFCFYHGKMLFIALTDYAPGTPMFASPEVLYHDQRHDEGLLIDPSLDVYSFGTLAYYLLSGSPLPVDVARICLDIGEVFTIVLRYLQSFCVCLFFDEMLMVFILFDLDLALDASMSAVANIMLHPKSKVDKVLRVAMEQNRISEQQASMLRYCLVDRVSMADVLKHTFFGVEFSPTYIRDVETKADVGSLIQGMGQQLNHHGAILEDISLSSSITHSSFLSSG